MNLLIVAIAAALLLLWGGILALLRMVRVFEPRHILGLGAYTTLVAGVIVGLVLFTIQERQREHRLEMQHQMEEVTRRLNELSERLVRQLVEKADLTASEFEIRARLQTEEANHRRTRTDLEKREQLLAQEQQRHRAYQEDHDQRLQERFNKEEGRYQSLRSSLDAHRSTLEGVKKQLAAIQEETGRIAGQTAALQNTQSGLARELRATREAQGQHAQQLEALTRKHAELGQALSRIRIQVDSLYTWRKD